MCRRQIGASPYVFHVIARRDTVGGPTWQSVLLLYNGSCGYMVRGCGLPHQCAHWFAMTMAFSIVPGIVLRQYTKT